MDSAQVTEAIVDRLERAMAQLLRELGEDAAEYSGVFVVEFDKGTVTAVGQE